MTILSRNDQGGRSMVEMLGVLAIIGVLSVGGISGYSKAMAKFKLTKAQDQISMILMNVRTAFATSPNYEGLTNASAIAFGIVPGEMSKKAVGDITINSDGTATSGASLNNPFGGEAHVFSCEATSTGVSPVAHEASCSDGSARVSGASYNSYFGIAMNNLGREVCTSLASSDWGSDGLVAMEITDSEGTTKNIYPSAELPLTMGKAMTDCSPGAMIVWTYY